MKPGRTGSETDRPTNPPAVVDLGTVESPSDVVGEITIDLDGEQCVEGVTGRGRLSTFHRRLLSALVIVLAVAALTSAATAPTRRWFEPRARVPVGTSDVEVLLAPDGFVVVLRVDKEVRGYGLDGALRWTTATPAVPVPRLAAGDVVLINFVSEAGVMALDWRTGRIRWQSDGSVLVATATVAVLSFPGAAANDDSSALGNPSAVAGLDIATGRELWRADLTADGPMRIVPVVRDKTAWQVDAVALIAEDGHGYLVDLLTGNRTPVTNWPQGGSEDYTIAFGFDGTIVVSSSGPHGDTVQAYGKQGSPLLWQRSMSGGILPCAETLCLVDSLNTTMLDLETGASGVVMPYGWTATLTPQRALALPNLINGAADGFVLIDSVTGTPIRSLSAWSVVDIYSSEWLAITRRTPDQQWEVGALRVSDGRVYHLGVIEAVSVAPCQANSTYVVCKSNDGEITVWRFPMR